MMNLPLMFVTHLEATEYVRYNTCQQNFLPWLRYIHHIDPGMLTFLLIFHLSVVQSNRSL